METFYMTAVQKPYTEPLVGWKPTTIPHIWETPDGKFVWTDETGNCGDDIAYTFLDDAASAMTVYCWFVLEGLGERLKHEDLEVTFKKSDGTLRTMFCTAKPGAFPVRESTERTKAPNPDVQVVWDLEKKAIRSFRRDSVTKFVARM
jgi:hypothetical protein